MAQPKHIQTALRLMLIGVLFLAGCSGQTGTALATPTGITVLPTTGQSDSIEPTPSLVGEVPQTGVDATQTVVNPTETAAAAEPSVTTCIAPVERTPPMTEGPYYKGGAPERVSLIEEGIPGERLVLTGLVLNESCQPVAGALVDFWQTDGAGQYDNAGYRLRGRQYTGSDGRYQLETVLPGEYPGRTPHIHVKVQAPGGPELTTQVFFPGVQANDSDRIFDQRLLVTVSEDGDGMAARYDFIVEAP